MRFPFMLLLRKDFEGRTINVNEAQPKGSAGGNRSDRFHGGSAGSW